MNHGRTWLGIVGVSSLLGLAGATAACSSEDAGATAGTGSGGSAGAAGSDSGLNLDGGPPPPDASTEGGITCQNPDAVAIPGTERCAGDLARATFLFALCSCTDIDISTSGFNVGGYDSTTKQKSSTGSVGANGKFIGGTGNIDGPLWAAGIGVTTQPVVTATNLGVTQDVTVGGDLRTNGIFMLDADAYVTGAVDGTGGVLQIDGKLHQPSTSPAPVGVTPGGGTTIEPVTVGEPCNCADQVPIASIVEAASHDHDDAAASLTPSSLVSFDSESLSLGCGRYYFDAITGNQLSLTIAGPTAIYVAGDFAAHASIQVLPGASLDLFVTGDMHLTGAWTLGSSEAPANTRVYVGGTSLTLQGAFSFNANLYAPNADVVLDNSAFNFSGALLAHRVQVLGVAASINYDQAVQDVTGCQTTGGGCKSCHDCAGATPACKGGACVPCTTNADCCAPHACMPDGTCGIVVK